MIAGMAAVFVTLAGAVDGAEQPGRDAMTWACPRHNDGHEHEYGDPDWAYVGGVLVANVPVRSCRICHHLHPDDPPRPPRRKGRR